MADFDVEALLTKQLRNLLKNLVKAIFTYKDRHKAKAPAKLDAIAKEMGHCYADMIGAEVKPT